MTSTHQSKSLAKDAYLVAVKLLLRDGSKLLVTHDIFGTWDIPGGRIRTDQFSEPLEDILGGKVRDELGNFLQYDLRGIATTLRIKRQEFGRDGETVRIFAVCYEGIYMGGEIALGGHHNGFEWIDLHSVDLEKYASEGGWVQHLKEYQKSVRREF